MYILPFARITLVSPKSLDAVSLLLLRAVPPRDSGSKRLENNLVEYYGSIWQKHFTIQRNLNYKNRFHPLFGKFNPFVPIIHGSLKPYEQGTKIILTATFSTLIIGTALLFYAVILIPMYFYLRESLSYGQFGWKDVSTILSLVILLYLWHTISFNHEVSMVKDFLARVVLARPLSRSDDTSSQAYR